MTTFHEREQAFEAKFAHDEELKFLLTVRRDKLFAGWAAERLRLNEPARASLTASVMAVRDGAQHDELVLGFMADALVGHGPPTSRADLAAVLEHCASQARLQMMSSPLDHAARRTDAH